MKNPSTIFSSILQNPASFTLKGNQAFVANASLGRLTCNQLATGHVVLHGPLGRRILMTDPDGHPLHECEWEERADGTVHLVSARLYLDWGQWVGLKPNGLVNVMNLDLTTRPEWQTFTRQDLRVMASRAMGVAVEEVEFFMPMTILCSIGPGAPRFVNGRTRSMFWRMAPGIGRGSCPA